MSPYEVDYVYLETTTYCNLDCSFCNRRDVVKHAQHMSLENWVVVQEKIKDFPIREAKLMGLGEPFLHPQFSDICRIFKEYHPNANIIVATNAQYTPNENFFESLQYIGKLYVSIDGTHEIYELERAPSKWSKLLSFLDNLEKNIERIKGCDLVVNYVVTEKTYDKIEDLKKEIMDRYKFFSKLRLNIAQWWSEGETVAITFDSKIIKEVSRNKDLVQGKSPWDFSDCFWPSHGFYMNVNGDVKICCLNTNTTPIGNVFKDNIDDILNSKKRVAIQNANAKNQPLDHCKACDYKSLSPVISKIRNYQEVALV